MAPVPLLDDNAIEAIIHGDAVSAEVAHLAAFAAQVRAAGQGPPPRPTPVLARLIAEGAPPGRRHGPRRALLAKAAGLSLVAKVALGAAATTVAAAGAGATGVLPGPAGRAVRDAIELVSPVDFGDRDHDPDPGHREADARRHGERVSSDATGAGDGQPGVDGTEVSRDAPGRSPAPRASPAQPGGPASPPAPPVTLPDASVDAHGGLDLPAVTPTEPTPPTTELTPPTTEPADRDQSAATGTTAIGASAP